MTALTLSRGDYPVVFCGVLHYAVFHNVTVLYCTLLYSTVL